MINLFTIYLDGIAPIIPLLVIVLCRIEFIGKWYIVVFLLTSIVGYLWADYIGVKDINNLLLYNLIPLFFSAALVGFYLKNLQTRLFKNIALFSFFFHLMHYAISYRKAFSNLAFESVFFVSFACMVSICSILYYLEATRFITKIPVWKTHEFWCVSLLFFYAASSTLIWTSYKYIIQKGHSKIMSNSELKLVSRLWATHNIVFALNCILLAILLLWRKSRPISN